MSKYFQIAQPVRLFLLDSSNYGIHLGSRILGPLFVTVWLYFYRKQNRYVVTLTVVRNSKYLSYRSCVQENCSGVHCGPEVNSS